jgi:hypothetical protein
MTWRVVVSHSHGKAAREFLPGIIGSAGFTAGERPEPASVLLETGCG